MNTELQYQLWAQYGEDNEFHGEWIVIGWYDSPLEAESAYHDVYERYQARRVVEVREVK